MHNQPDLTLERHREIGLELAHMRDRLQTLVCELENAPTTSGYSARNLDHAVTRIDRARVSLDALVYRLFPEADSWVYYPTQEERKTAPLRGRLA